MIVAKGVPMFGLLDPRTVYVLMPAVLHALILGGGLAYVAGRRRSGQPWSQLALGGLGLLLLSALGNLVLMGSTFTGHWIMNAGPIIGLISLLMTVAQLLGLGLLVASTLTGRAGSVGPGARESNAGGTGDTARADDTATAS